MEMFPSNNNISNSTNSFSEETVISSVTRVHDFTSLNPMLSNFSSQNSNKIKKKRNLPGNPDPEAEVIALSPKTLMATNRFVCEICNKGFQRDQNLQLHRRGHNLPWKLKQRNSKDIIKKRVYVCPEIACVHHHPSRALGDLTGIKKHFCRKHGEKKWKCEKCSKIYAVQSDWKAHSKTCGTREYRCDCGTLFSRKDSFVTHRAFCDALAEESARLSSNPNFSFTNPHNSQISHPLHSWDAQQIKPEFFHQSPAATSSAHLSATALLQKANSVGSQPVGHVPCTMSRLDYIGSHGYANRLTRDFLGLTGHHDVSSNSSNNVDVSLNVRNLLTYTGGVEFSGYHERDNSQQNNAFGFSEAWRNC